ncbi:hypothetical protein LguiA_017813 [Lonicera macranthoides]
MAAFAWIKCEREEDKDCYKVLKEGKIKGRGSMAFGAEKSYVRLSLCKSNDDFDLLLQRIEKLAFQEEKCGIYLSWYKAATRTTLGRLGAPKVELRRCQNNAWPAAATNREQGLVEVPESWPGHPKTPTTSTTIGNVAKIDIKPSESWIARELESAK